jgi:perosamine synthetase
MKKIPQYEPYFSGLEKKYLIKCIEDSWITAGKNVDDFQKAIASKCEVKHSMACCNGTVAIFVALKACGIGKGHQVVVPDFTHVATANSVLLTGATPVFCDIDRETLCIDFDANTAKTYEAIVPVGMYGNVYDVEAISSTKAKVIHDAAQCLGVKYKNRPIQQYTDISTLSFYGDKVISTGEGGMVLTDSDELIHKAKLQIHHGSERMGTYFHEEIGWNFRLTDLQAGVGLGQLSVLDEIIKRKRANDRLYRELLGDSVIFQRIEDDCYSVPFRHVIFVENVEDLFKYLTDRDIQTRRLFYPLHMQPCYQYLNPKDAFPNSVWAYEHGLALPSSAKLSSDDIEYVCDAIKDFLNEN